MIINQDSLLALKELDTDSIDAVITDPPYGYSFMGKDWDKAVPSVEIWKECLRVLKPGGWCMVMSAPRSDVQNAMISRLMEAGFRLDFTPIYWTYASGFPKAGNVGKLVDKRNGRPSMPTQEFRDYLRAAKQRSGLTSIQIDKALGFDKSAVFSPHYIGNNLQVEYPTMEKYQILKELLNLDDTFDSEVERVEAEREVVGKYKSDAGGLGGIRHGQKGGDITVSSTPQAKALDGSYTGFQPKPAVEVVIVAMKPLSEKTYVDQALKNGKGITWLDDCRVPTEEGFKNLPAGPRGGDSFGKGGDWSRQAAAVETSGRFTANLLVSDDVLNGHSKYFNLDAWADTLPFLAVPKASKSEKNKGLEHMEDRLKLAHMRSANGTGDKNFDGGFPDTITKNHHPTVKPLKLMSYLITLTTRQGDTVLDPFVGSGTTVVAAKQLDRIGIGIEREEEYAEIAQARVEAASVPAL